MKNLFIQLLKDEDGQGLVEYGIILALIAAICIAVIARLGKKTEGALNKIDTEMGTALGGGGGGQ